MLPRDVCAASNAKHIAITAGLKFKLQISQTPKRLIWAAIDMASVGYHISALGRLGFQGEKPKKPTKNGSILLLSEHDARKCVQDARLLDAGRSSGNSGDWPKVRTNKSAQ
jgi:hypothetical protein